MAGSVRVVSAAVLLLAGFSDYALGAERPSALVGVRLFNHAAVDAETLDRARVEVARIYREAGVQIEWPGTDTASSADGFTVQMIIRRKAVGVTADPRVMGTTLGDDHPAGGTAFVFYERVLNTAHAREQDVAQVLGYAIAHEIGHLLLPSPAHASTGIMRAEWNGDDLRHMAGGALTFTPTQVELIRAKLVSCSNVVSSLGGTAIKR
jgi:hypothetical protein